MIRIYIVDDHDLVRAGVRSMLQPERDLEVIGEFACGEDVIKACRERCPDVVLMDINMPGIGGIEATKRLAAAHPDIGIIAVTAMDADPFPGKLLDAGARGYLSKASNRDEMLEAIRTVTRGNHFISSEVAKKLAITNLRNHGDESPISSLSAREMQVMMMVIQGHGNQEISDTLCLSPKTVYTYRARIFEKLNVANDVELTHFGIRHGLIEPA